MYRPLQCQMRVRGHLSNNWSDWLGMDIVNQPDGYCLLSGILADSAALYGAINRLRDLDLLLTELECHELNPQSSNEVGE